MAILFLDPKVKVLCLLQCINNNKISLEYEEFEFCFVKEMEFLGVFNKKFFLIICKIIKNTKFVKNFFLYLFMNKYNP